MKCEDGKLPTAWTIKPLGTICEVVRGGSPRPIMNYLTTSPTGVNWLKIGDVGETDKYFTRAAERIKLEGTTKSRKVERGDLLLSNSMSFGRAFITLIDGYIHDGWLRLRSDERVLDKEYLYYFLLSPFAQNQFKSVATGSVVANLKSETVKALEVLLPPLPEQKRIAAILSSLDDKIELNNKINANLEQQAQALFNEICKNGDSFSLADILEVCYGKDHKRLRDGGVPCYGTGGVMRYVERALYEGESVLIPRKGSLNNVMYVNEAFWTVDTLFYTQMKRPNIAKLVYFFLCNLNLAKMNVGSAVPSMTTAILNAIEITLPDEETCSRFERIVSPMFLQIQSNKIENCRLAKIRDVLLQALIGSQTVKVLDL